VAAWWAALERVAEAETFFSAVLGFIAAGYKPRRPDKRDHASTVAVLRPENTAQEATPCKARGGANI
jgi:hypothetical protein